jgi:hypothetical protein
MVKTGVEFYKSILLSEKGEIIRLFIYTDEKGIYHVHKNVFDGVILYSSKRTHDIRKWLENYCELNNYKDVTLSFKNSICEAKTSQTGAPHHNQYS